MKQVKIADKIGYFDFYTHYDNFTKHLSQIGFKRLDSGDFRSVWVRNKIVIKIPLSMDGAIDNLVEAKAWRKYKKKKAKLGIYLAPCRILPNCTLMMVKVNLSYSYKKNPDWSQMIDQEQVGIYKKRFVCYDYALDIPERIEWEKEWGVPYSFFQDEYVQRRPHLISGKLPRKGKIIDSCCDLIRE